MSKLSENKTLVDMIISLIGLSKEYNNEIDLMGDVLDEHYGHIEIAIKKKHHWIVVESKYPKISVTIGKDVVYGNEITEALDMLEINIQKELEKQSLEDTIRKIVKEELNKTRGEDR